MLADPRLIRRAGNTWLADILASDPNFSLRGADGGSDVAPRKPAKTRRKRPRQKPPETSAAEPGAAATATSSDLELVVSWPNPITEMAAVARMFLRCSIGAGKRVVYWEGLGWFVYDGRRYVQHTDEEFEQYLYHFFGPKHYQKIDGRKNEVQIVAFNPDGNFLRRCRESVRPQALQKNLVHDSWLDGRKDRVIPLRNGLLDLDTGGFIEGHDPLFFNTYCLPFDYDPDATCERFDSLLEEIWPDDPGSRTRFLQYLGVVLNGRGDLQKMLLMIGRTGSGKSVLSWLMEQMVSPEAFAPLTSDGLSRQFGIYPLVGKKLGIFHDARDSSRAKEIVPVLLSLTGEDSVTAEIKYSKKPWTGRLGIHLVYVSNVPPALPDNTKAVERRLLPLWFEHTVPERRRDPRLKDKLADELAGIFNRALVEWNMFETRGYRFAEAPSADHLLATVSAKSSPLLQWVEEECIVGGSKDPDSDDYVWTPTTALFRDWKQWAEENGHRAGSSAWFGAELRGAVDYIEPRRKRVGKKPLYGYAGISLVPDEALGIRIEGE